MGNKFDSIGIGAGDSTRLFELMYDHPQMKAKDVGPKHDPHVQLTVQTSPGETLFEFLKQKDWICLHEAVLTCQRPDCTEEFRVTTATFGDKVTVTHIAVG